MLGKRNSFRVAKDAGERDDGAETASEKPSTSKPTHLDLKKERLLSSNSEADINVVDDDNSNDSSKACAEGQADNISDSQHPSDPFCADSNPPAASDWSNLARRFSAFSPASTASESLFASSATPPSSLFPPIQRVPFSFPFLAVPAYDPTLTLQIFEQQQAALAQHYAAAAAAAAVATTPPALLRQATPTPLDFSASFSAGGSRRQPTTTTSSFSSFGPMANCGRPIDFSASFSGGFSGSPGAFSGAGSSPASAAIYEQLMQLNLMRNSSVTPQAWPGGILLPTVAAAEPQVQGLDLSAARLPAGGEEKQGVTAAVVRRASDSKKEKAARAQPSVIKRTADSRKQFAENRAKSAETAPSVTPAAVCAADPFARERLQSTDTPPDVDAHFEKALGGETWKKLKEQELSAGDAGAAMSATASSD